MMHKKDMIFLSILIACSESVVLFYFCSAKSPRSFLCMMISYAILLIFPLNIFLASLREHRTGTSLSTLETTEESSKQQREIEQFTHKQLKLHKNNFTQKLKELYILLEQNDLTTAQKILGEQIPLKDTDIICCTNSIVDGILQSKKSECIQHNISFEYTILFPEKNDFSFSVLISLFSNLLDNAIESCQMASSLNPKSERRVLMMHKKDMIFLSILIACSESVVLFYFCSAKSPRSFLCMMISYAILLIFPLNIFLASLREHRTGTSLSTLETTEESSKQQREIEQFTHKQLKLHKNNFTQKLKELYILLEQNDLTTAQKILGEQIPLKDTDIICCTNSIVDGILQSKKSECIQHNISFEYTILFPEKNDFSFSVLISLFSNLLDNAIESCQMASSLNPKIELSIDYKGDFLIIFMQNTKETALIFNSLARKTTKSDSLSHGFGLSIIEEIVKSYDGFCEWEDRGNIFESRIMLRYLL